MHLDSFGRLFAPVLGLLVSLDTYAELVQEGLQVSLVLDGNEDGFKILGEIYLLLVSLTWRVNIFFI